jgi:hypothetical protein
LVEIKGVVKGGAKPGQCGGVKVGQWFGVGFGVFRGRRGSGA